MKCINEIIRDFREDNDLSQLEVANLLKIPRSTYARYEIIGSNIDLETLTKLCTLYKVTPNDMLGFTLKNNLSSAKVVKLCKIIEEKNLDIDEIIKLLNIITNLSNH